MELDKSRMPKHIGIIMDGNGRWAKSKGLTRTLGHKQGVETLKIIGEECRDLGIEYLTVYAFSTENWKRSQDEVSALMGLIETYMIKELSKLHRENVRLRIIGDTTKLPKTTQEKLKSAIDLTCKNTGITLTVALNYGGRADIVEATKKIAIMVKNGDISESEINEELFAKNLSTNYMPDPDMIIRPSGEYRLSNFLMWEAAYSEFWFSNINWPDFGRKELRSAIYDYQNRDRRFGNAK